MIKVDMTTVKLEGSEPVLAAELSMAIRSFYKVLAEKQGEDIAKEKIEHCYKRALEENPEVEALKRLTQKILEDFLSAIKGEEKEGEK